MSNGAKSTELHFFLLLALWNDPRNQILCVLWGSNFDHHYVWAANNRKGKLHLLWIIFIFLIVGSARIGRWSLLCKVTTVCSVTKVELEGGRNEKLALAQKLSIRNSIHNSRQKKWCMDSTAVFASGGWEGQSAPVWCKHRSCLSFQCQKQLLPPSNSPCCD